MNARISELPALARWGWLGVLAVLSVIFLGQGGTAQRDLRGFPPPLARPLPTGLNCFSLTAALGDEARAAADVDYIGCLQYVGGDNLNDGFWGKTLPLYAEVEWLDPSFRHAILEGISALGWLYGRPGEAETLARTALAVDHSEPRYAVYIAALAYQKHLDIREVLGLLEPQARSPGASSMLLRVVGNLILQQRDWPRAFAYWTWVEANTQDQDTLDMAARSLTLIHKHLIRPVDLSRRLSSTTD